MIAVIADTLTNCEDVHYITHLFYYSSHSRRAQGTFSDWPHWQIQFLPLGCMLFSTLIHTGKKYLRSRQRVRPSLPSTWAFCERVCMILKRKTVYLVALCYQPDALECFAVAFCPNLSPLHKEYKPSTKSLGGVKIWHKCIMLCYFLFYYCESIRVHVLSQT